MFKKLYPHAYAESVFSIDYNRLYKSGFRGLIFDIDNTLVHHGDDSTEQTDALFKTLHNIGFKTLLLSDNDEERILRFNKSINTLYISDADKPKPESFLKAVRMMGLKKEQCLVIGDQIFKDILGANNSGLASILVKFIRLKTEAKFGKRRQLENIILWFYKHNRVCRNRLGDILKDEVQ